MFGSTLSRVPVPLPISWPKPGATKTLHLHLHERNVALFCCESTRPELLTHAMRDLTEGC